jgi:putative tricarboxylic transport membrane protein
MMICVGMALVAIVFYGFGNFTQQVNQDDPGPAFYPRALAVLLFAFSFVQMVLSWRKRKAQSKDEAAPERKETFSYKILLGTLVLSVIYGFVFDKVSYLLTTTCFLLAMMLLGGVRKWHILLGVAVCYSVGTYFLFGEVLMVPLK